MVNIKIIIGSTRPGRFGVQPAHWLMDLAKGRTNVKFELVDLKELALPFLDEPELAATGKYANEHTKKWSAQVAAADGFIMVTPEYNHSYSPVLKNAIDYLYAEWNNKPVAFTSYGAHAGGSLAVEHLRPVVALLKMYDLQEHVTIPNYYLHLNEEGKWQPNEEQVKKAEAMLDAVVFWAGQMKTARAELASAQAPVAA
jgi:NAD(P)H-dependent FMN reductase